MTAMLGPARLAVPGILAALAAWTAAAGASAPSRRSPEPFWQAQPPPARRASPAWVDVSTGVTARRDVVRIECAEATWPECTYEEEVTLALAGPSPAERPAAPPAGATSASPAATTSAPPVASSAPPPAAPRGTVRPVWGNPFWRHLTIQVRDPRSGGSRTADVPLNLGPGDEVTLVARGHISLEPGCAAYHAGCGRGEETPIAMRHPLLDAPPRRYHATHVNLAEAPEGEVKVTFPASWSLQLHGTSAGDQGPLAVASASQGAMMTRTVKVPAGPASVISVERSIETPAWRRLGGPLVGVGSDLSIGDRPARLSVRAGYEVASTSYLLHALTVDTNFRRVVVAPSTEVVVAGSWLNTASIGLGVPVRVSDGVGVGVRGQLSLQLSFVGLVQTFDYYPARAGGSERFASSFYAQMTF